MWKNKHVVVALLVAPVLALIAYFAVDAAVSEAPHAAKEGESYPLRVMSSCRYASGECELRNGDVRVRLWLDEATTWHLTSEVALSGAMIGGELHAEPVAMLAGSDDGREWRLDTHSLPVEPDHSMRLVVAVAKSRYFAEFPGTFAGEGRQAGPLQYGDE